MRIRQTSREQEIEHYMMAASSTYKTEIVLF